MLHNKVTTHVVLKTRAIYYLTVLWVQKSRWAQQVLCLGSHKAEIQVSVMQDSSLEALGNTLASKLSQVICRLQLFVAVGLTSLLFVGCQQRLLSAPGGLWQGLACGLLHFSNREPSSCQISFTLPISLTSSAATNRRKLSPL